MHADLVLLREDASQEDREALFREAATLRSLRGIVATGVIEADPGSDFDLAFFFVVSSLTDLEAFGTDARYVRFLQGAIARAMRSFGGADVKLSAAFDAPGEHAACVALAATPQTYDWQVSDALQAWGSRGGRALIGLATGERQRYRGIGIMFSNLPMQRPSSGFEGFGLEFIAGRCRLLSQD